MPTRAFPNVLLQHPLFPHDAFTTNVENLKKMITSPGRLAAHVKQATDEAKQANFTISQGVADEALKA